MQNDFSTRPPLVLLPVSHRRFPSLPFALFLFTRAKSYYRTIDRAPSIRATFGRRDDTSSYQNSSVHGDLFSHRRPPRLPHLHSWALSTSFAPDIPHPVFPRTCSRRSREFDAWGYFATSPINSTLSSGERRTRGRLSAWKFECDELNE